MFTCRVNEVNIESVYFRLPATKEQTTDLNTKKNKPFLYPYNAF